MTVRADWHTIDLETLVAEEGELDPFSAPVEELGEPIDLTDPVARLNVRLAGLLERESALWSRDIRCPIRQEAKETTCLACPVSEHTDFDSPLGMLCRVGRESDQVVTELEATRCRRANLVP